MTQPQANQTRNAAIARLAATTLTDLLPRVDWESPHALSIAQTIYRAVVVRYGQAAASIAAQFYDERRTESGAPGLFRAIPADPLPQTVTDRAVASAFQGVTITETPQTTSELPLPQRVETRLDDSVGRHVLQPARDTIAENTAKDPVQPRYIRVPRGATTCAFCIMLASRQLGDIAGPQKRSFGGYHASNVKHDTETGRLHVFAENGGKYHDHCDCEAVPVFPGDDVHDLSPNFVTYQDMYYKAASDAGTHSDAKKILASMRQLHGLK